MSITAVPLQPAPKGALGKLWLGLGACAVLAAGLAYAGTRGQAGGSCGTGAFLSAGGDVTAPITTASGLRFQTVKPGSGPKLSDSDVALISYRGTLANGKVFDENPRAPLPVAGVVPGFSEGLKLMQKGGSYRLCIPSQLGYGAKGTPGGPIPPNAVLRFEVSLLDYRSRAELEAQMQRMQQMQQQSQNH